MAIVTISVNKKELNEKKEQIVAVGVATAKTLEKGGIKTVDFIHTFTIGFAHKHLNKGV